MQKTLTKRARAPVRATRGPLEPLEAYFRDVAAHELLSAEEEQRLAREIESLDIDSWTELLSYPPTVSHVLHVVEKCMDNALPAFRSLRGVATRARSKRTKAAREMLRQAARSVAESLRPLDLDRNYREAVRADLRRLIEAGRRGKLSFAPSSRGFKDWMARVYRQERHVEAARSEFINANLRLVVTVARKYRFGAMPLEDLIQEGNLGLMKAVDRFDHRRGLRFSTYATWWIRHNVGRAIAEKSRTIRLPVHLVDSRQRIRKMRRELLARLGRMPTIEEVAKASDLTPEKVDIIERRLPERRMSLDQPLGDSDGDRTRFDIFQRPDEDDPTPFDALESKDSRVMIRQLLEHLKPVEADVLRQRFGLEDDHERTLQYVARQYGLSRERIRQIQEEAFGKLRRMLAARVA